MGKEKFMKDFNGEKIFSLEYDKETLRDMVIEKQEEIERLENIIKEVRELLKNDYFEDGSFNNQEKVFELLDKEEV